MDIQQPPSDEVIRQEMRRGGATVPVAAVLPPLGRLSFSAIFAGAIVAVALSIVLNLLGLGIGAIAVNPAQPGGEQGLGIGAAIWAVVSSLIAMFVGGWVAGRFCNGVRRADGVLHGIVTWGFVTVFALYVAASAAGSVVGGMANLVGSSIPLASRIERGDLNRARQQIQSSPDAEQRLRSAGGEVADVVGSAAIMSAIALLLGGLVSGLGGAAGLNRVLRREAPTRTAIAHDIH